MRFGIRWRVAAVVAVGLAMLGAVVTVVLAQAPSATSRTAQARSAEALGAQARTGDGSAAQSHPLASTRTGPGAPGGTRTGAGTACGVPPGPLPRQLLVPDMIGVLPGGISAGRLARIGGLSGVRGTLALDGGRLAIGGGLATVIGADPQALRAWTPPRTAADVAAWTALANGGLLARASAVTTAQASLTGRVRVTLPVSTTRDLGVPGVDAVVDGQLSAQLGLAGHAAVLINAPGADLRALMPEVRAILGPAGQVTNLVPIVVYSKLPVTAVRYTGTPANYVQLYQESAARYCPGLSWTVLAAIGEIESGHGRNDGPSSAGALGPMQFLPSTWAIYGIDGFSDTGQPDIMNPLDAVPSAAHMLCADGATAGLPGLRAAIFAYNHATWYVDEVLQLAAEYAAAYP